jgi:hypothetical protein
MQNEPKQVKEINLRVKDGDVIFAHETTINFSPAEFTFDFKSLANIQDVPNQNTMLMKHSVVLMAPHHVKAFSEILAKVVKDFEKNFGKIEKPNAIEKAEKMMKKQQEKISSATTSEKSESYFG